MRIFISTEAKVLTKTASIMKLFWGSTDKSSRKARILLKFPGRLNVICLLFFFFAFISGLLNDSNFKFALLCKRTLFPAHVTTVLQGTCPGAQEVYTSRSSVNNLQRRDSCFAVFSSDFSFVFIFMLSYMGRFDCLISFKVPGFHRGQTSKAFFAWILFASKWKQRAGTLSDDRKCVCASQATGTYA